jgi:hypothetical protein
MKKLLTILLLSVFQVASVPQFSDLDKKLCELVGRHVADVPAS